MHPRPNIKLPFTWKDWRAEACAWLVFLLFLLHGLGVYFNASGQVAVHFDWRGGR
jgi:hypothetical protein